jgi:hypothetical protein
MNGLLVSHTINQQDLADKVVFGSLHRVSWRYLGEGG